jgi:hypothetical protein
MVSRRLLARATLAAASERTQARRLLRWVWGLAVCLIACSESARSESAGHRLDRLGARLASLPEAALGRAADDAAPRRAPVLELLDRHESGQFDRGAAEIVHYHAGTRRVFVVNALARRVTVLELGARGFGANERELDPRRDIAHFRAGQVTSVAISGDRVAVAVRAADNDRRGRVAFYSAVDLSYLGAISVGFGPDMLTFTPDGQTLLVANEGEQVRNAEQRIVADPAGSVSIVDVSRGIEAAPVAHAGFEAFDARIEEYRNAGVRIPRLGDRFFETGEGEVRLSTDLEPEYIAIAPDGKTAWVSLQENDAVAVLDVKARSFTEILPLGVKDFSHGRPSIASLPLAPSVSPASLGASSARGPHVRGQAAPAIAGLWFEPRTSGDGVRQFYLLRGGAIERRELGRDARPTAAVSTIAIGDAHAWRGLVRDPADGSYWIGDADRAVVYQLTPAGSVARELGLGASARGVVGLAFDATHRWLYVVQHAPSAAGSHAARTARIRVVDIDDTSPRFGEPLAEHLYGLSEPGPDGAPRRVAGVALVASEQLLVLEHGASGSSAPELFRADLTGASDVLGASAFELAAFDPWRARELDDSSAVQLVHKRRAVRLPEPGPGVIAGGIAVLDLERVVIAVDEPSAAPGGTLATARADGGRSSLELVSFDEQNRFDASDRDGQVTLRHWPVLGGYMPDGIEALRRDGVDYFVTANEGDTRGYDARRLADVELDPERFPYAAALQSRHALGRLEISTLDGDLDADGDLDEIHAFGARSLSVWDAAGQLVFDTGSLLEEVTALALSTGFNSNNDANGSFDTRSDNKGPEPEGLDVGEIDGRFYVFLGLERVGGIVVLDVTDPRHTSFVEYVNPRNFEGDAARGGARDLGPEGVEFVPAGESPTGRGLLLVANEVSGTTTAYHVNL